MMIERADKAAARRRLENAPLRALWVLVILALPWLTATILPVWKLLNNGNFSPQVGLVLVITVVEVGSLLVGSLVASYRLAPQQNWGDVFRTWPAFLGWLCGVNRSSFRISDAKVQRTIPAGFKLLPGVILVDAHSAVVTRKNFLLHRALGAGAHFSQSSETVALPENERGAIKTREALDLRRQTRVQVVSALTKDGLAVNIRLRATFMLDRDKDAERDQAQPFRFYVEAAFKAVRGERVDAKSGERYDWTTLPLARAAEQLLEQISLHDFDALYAPHSPDAPANVALTQNPLTPSALRRQIGSTIREELRDDLLRDGIQLIAISIGPIKPVDEKVSRERVDYWRATRTRQIRIDTANMESAVKKDIESQRADAQRALLISTVKGLENMPAEYRRIMVPLRFLTAIEAMMTQSAQQKNDLPNTPKTS